MGLAIGSSAAAFFGVLLIVVGFFQARGSKSPALRRLEKRVEALDPEDGDAAEVLPLKG